MVQLVPVTARFLSAVLHGDLLGVGCWVTPLSLRRLTKNPIPEAIHNPWVDSPFGGRE